MLDKVFIRLLKPNARETAEALLRYAEIGSVDGVGEIEIAELDVMHELHGLLTEKGIEAEWFRVARNPGHKVSFDNREMGVAFRDGIETRPLHGDYYTILEHGFADLKHFRTGEIIDTVLVVKAGDDYDLWDVNHKSFLSGGDFHTLHTDPTHREIEEYLGTGVFPKNWEVD